MRVTLAAVLSAAFLGVGSDGLHAQDYLTKDGQLTHQLKVVQLQGGFAGNTGVQYTIAPDGTWTAESIFKQKATPKNKGKLTEKDLAKLGLILEKYDLVKLPAKSGKPPGANPHTISLEFGKMNASLVSQTPPRLDPKNPTGTLESRFAGILEGVVGLLTPEPSPKEEKKESHGDAIKKDRKNIEGTWRVVALEVNGEKTRDEDASKLTVVNGSDGTWSLRSGDNEISSGTSTIDPTNKPKTIDFVATKGEVMGRECNGIYELGEKTRKLCFSTAGKERPTEFSSSPGSEHILVTLEREKAK